MLRSFRLENHRSFKGEAELSLIPAYRSDRPVVPVAAIYGANAAGKSNLLDGLRFMADAVHDSYRRWEPDAGISRQPFRLDPTCRSAPSTFVVDLVLDGVRHVYGFLVDDERVVEEWLYSYPKSRRRTLFVRNGDDVEFGSTVSEPRARSEVLAELTRPNALFLSLAAQVGFPELAPVREWFARGLYRERRDTWPLMDFAPASLVRSIETDRERFLDLLRAADVGISDVFLEELELPRLSSDLIDISWVPDRVHVRRSFDPEDASLVELSFRDPPQRLRLVHGSGAEPFAIHDESAGTQSWIVRIPTVLRVLKHGLTLVIDEIDTSLHPHLTAYLIKLFESPETNPEGAQLVFTTHDASLLGTAFGEELLARDQIWFVAKDADGSSQLYPLTDFHPRKGENRERRYLGGSYGAVPVVEEPASHFLGGDGEVDAS